MSNIRVKRFSSSDPNSWAMDCIVLPSDELYGEFVHFNPNTTDTFYATFDGNGNVTGLVDASDGTSPAVYEYDPFENLLRATGPMAQDNPFRFSTKYQDGESGLVYYGYRWYEPVLGRWLSRDPIGEDGGNSLFAFVNNEPISSYDALGNVRVIQYGTPIEKKCGGFAQAWNSDLTKAKQADG